jgi:hypothetical protein
MNTPIKIHSTSEQRVTVYYSLEEGWIHILTFDASVEQKSETVAKSEVIPYSERQMRYLQVRAEVDPCIYIFQARRYEP